MSSLRLTVASALAALALAACSSTPAPLDADEPAPPAPVDTAAAEAEARADLPPGTIARADVDAALRRGPAWLLGRVETEEVIKNNKFVGWRIVQFPAEWDGSGLQPGDVVMDVNGLALEKPDDFWNVWMAAAEASEIKIGFERDAKPQTAVLKIEGAPSADTKEALAKGEPAPDVQQAPPDKKGRKPTIVIQGQDNNPVESSAF